MGMSVASVGDTAGVVLGRLSRNVSNRPVATARSATATTVTRTARTTRTVPEGALYGRTVSVLLDMGGSFSLIDALRRWTGRALVSTTVPRPC